MTVRVKICGITRKEDVDGAVEAGADALGFIVGIPSSPRNLTVAKAVELIKHVPLFVSSVVVTSPTIKMSTYNRLFSSHLQIVGGELSPANLLELYRKVRIIKVVNVTPATIPMQNMKFSRNMYYAILVDSHYKGHLGGTGATHDWRVSRRIRELISPLPLILAGGLTELNVVQAIREVQPYAVDVSTGVEVRPGVKDHDRMRRFIEAVKGVVS